MHNSDMTETWRPLGVDEDDSDYSVLFEDVTDWLKPSLLSWLTTTLTSNPIVVVPPIVDIHTIRSLERLLRFTASSIEEYTSAESAAANLLHSFIRWGHPWRLIDATLATGSGNAKNLKQILQDAGSAWTVGERAGKSALIRRVNEGTDAAVQNTIATRGHAGKRLAEAYHAAFGVNPDPSKAYSSAVKAVEDAAKPVVSPNNHGTTLGTIIRDVRSTASWKLPQTRVHPDADPHDVLLGMMQMLWTGQHDRHGGATPPPPPVSVDEAETAVMLAATLVEWFASGKVQKIP
jgi:hypothetical protein